MKLDYTTFLKTFFTNKKAFQEFDDSEKEKFFFMFNKYVAKAYPENAEAFNKKSINKSLAIDIWYEFFFNTNKTPSYFSFRKKKKLETYGLSKIDYLILKDDIEKSQIDIKQQQKENKLNLKPKKIKK